MLSYPLVENLGLLTVKLKALIYGEDVYRRGISVAIENVYLPKVMPVVYAKDQDEYLDLLTS